MRKCLLGLLTFVPLAFCQTQTFTYSYSGLPIPLYPDDWKTVSVIRLMVPRSILISKVTATVAVQFSGVVDLNIFLWSANGTRTKLLDETAAGW